MDNDHIGGGGHVRYDIATRFCGCLERACVVACDKVGHWTLDVGVGIGMLMLRETFSHSW